MSSRRGFRTRHRHEEGDDHVFIAGVYERYAGHVAAYALRRAPHAEAADVVADTFLVAWRRHGAIPPEPDTLPWLYGVARRVLANQRRARDRRGRLHDRLRAEFVEFRVATDSLEEAEHFRRVASALEHLSTTDAELLRLSAWEGLSPAEIAVVMNIDPAAVRQRLHRARDRLRRQLADGKRPPKSVDHRSGRSGAPRQAAMTTPHWAVEDRS